MPRLKAIHPMFRRDLTLGVSLQRWMEQWVEDYEKQFPPKMPRSRWMEAIIVHEPTRITGFSHKDAYRFYCFGKEP